MPDEFIHRFERESRRFAIDPENCFCFECDGISWDVLEYYPRLPVNRIYHLLSDKYSREELMEVVSELEWLRATKSILSTPKKDDIAKKFEVERGLKKLTVHLPAHEGAEIRAKRWWRQTDAPRPSADFVRAAVQLLPARSSQQKDIHLEFVARAAIDNPREVAALCKECARIAALTGKRLKISVTIDNPPVPRAPEPLQGHGIRFALQFAPAFGGDFVSQVENFANTAGRGLGKLQSAMYPQDKHVSGIVTVRPASENFDAAVRVLDEADFLFIMLDLEGACAANPDQAPARLLGGMNRTLDYYTQRLLKRRYFRLEPIAGLFQHIYLGRPRPRIDLAGTNELAISDCGDIYPSPPLCELGAMRAGSIDGGIDEKLLQRFEDVGALTTGPCMCCWARNLCGGGNTAVHHALGGSFRRPSEAWCDFQREWMAQSIASFHKLSSAGIQFDRVYKTLGRKEKPSLFLIARAALTMHIGVRPVEEADAPMLMEWENWNKAAYFLYTETGLLLATKYDREMESLHPRPEKGQELVLLRRNGAPLGLIKIRPDKLPGLATILVYLHDEADYASDSIRKSFRTVLKELSGRKEMRRIIFPAAAYETGLRDFLQGIGFTETGVIREGIYLHGKYHDVVLYASSVA